MESVTGCPQTAIGSRGQSIDDGAGSMYPVLVKPLAIFVILFLDVVGEPVAEEVNQMKVERDLSAFEARRVVLDLLQ